MQGITGEIIYITIWTHIPIQYHIFFGHKIVFLVHPGKGILKPIYSCESEFEGFRGPKLLILCLFALLWKFQMMPKIWLWAVAGKKSMAIAYGTRSELTGSNLSHEKLVTRCFLGRIKHLSIVIKTSAGGI